MCIFNTNNNLWLLYIYPWRILSRLSNVEATVIKHYFGFPPYKVKTLDEIGTILHLTRERVRQIKEKAISNIQKDSSCDKLRPFINKNFTIN